ncbi:hypothetical protein [Parasynechococcus sp.]|uniref:hypothetical protein n=1 Tax=Parasynechococcus sp. TaxID=3101203 RepID=UPI00370458E0
MSFWHSVTHVGSFVKSEVSNAKTVYTSTVHSVADAVSEASQDVADTLTGSGDLLDEVEHFTQFVVTKGNGLVKHYMDTDGDGVFNKKVDTLIGKAKAPAGSFFSDIEGEAHSILGDSGTMYVHGLDALEGKAVDAYKDFLGHTSSIAGDLDLGFWDTVNHGITTVGTVLTSGPSLSVGSSGVHVSL